MDQNAVGVSAYAVVLYHVAATAKHQADTEVVTRRSDGTIPAKFEFLTETFSSRMLSDTVFMNMPLKQLWCEVTSFTFAFVLTPLVPRMKIPCRRNFLAVREP